MGWDGVARRECFNGIGKVSKDFYEWWDTKRGENVWIGVLVAIGIVLLFIFVLLPAALAILIIAGILFVAAVIIDAIYGKPETADAPTKPSGDTEATPAPEPEEKV